jgi:hypothetical protein
MLKAGTIEFGHGAIDCTDPQLSQTTAKSGGGVMEFSQAFWSSLSRYRLWARPPITIAAQIVNPANAQYIESSPALQQTSRLWTSTVRGSTFRWR